MDKKSLSNDIKTSKNVEIIIVLIFFYSIIIFVLSKVFHDYSAKIVLNKKCYTVNNKSLNNIMSQNTVPFEMIINQKFGIIFIIILSYLLNNNTKKLSYSLLYDISYIILTFSITSVLTAISKMGGYLRPDFMGRCFGNSAKVTDIIQEYGNKCISFDKCPEYNINNKTVMDGVRSFFSGHSSMSFALGGSLIYLYYKGNMRNRIKSQISEPYKYIKYIDLLIIAIGLLFPSFVAISRIANNRHHTRDVLFGSIIGSLMAIILGKMMYKKYLF